jgi:hypothetical protein
VARIEGFIRIPIPKKSITTSTIKAIIVLFIFSKRCSLPYMFAYVAQEL